MAVYDAHRSRNSGWMDGSTRWLWECSDEWNLCRGPALNANVKWLIRHTLLKKKKRRQRERPKMRHASDRSRISCYDQALCRTSIADHTEDARHPVNVRQASPYHTTVLWEHMVLPCQSAQWCHSRHNLRHSNKMSSQKLLMPWLLHLRFVCENKWTATVSLIRLCTHRLYTLGCDAVTRFVTVQHSVTAFSSKTKCHQC